MATPMMQQFHRIKREYPEEIIFFRMGDFFEMFHEDAVNAHEILGLTLTKRSHGKGEVANTPLCGFPHHQLETYLAKMTRAGKRVIVVEQVEDPKKAKGLVKRDIVRIVTSGTNFSEEVLDGGKNQYLATIVFKDKWAGLAVVDVTTGEFTTTSVPVTQLADLLELLSPNEIVYSEEQRDQAREVIRSAAMQTRIAPWFFEYDFARDTLISHFKVQTLKGFGIEEDTLAVCAAGANLQYVRENLRTEPDHIRELHRLPIDKYLVLDASTRRNLELFEPAWGGDRSGTLLYHIDKTITPFGKRLFYQWIVRPLTDRKQVQARLDAVEELVSEPRLRDGVRDRLRGLGDLERLTARLAAKRGSPRDAGALRDTLARLPGIIKHLEKVQSGNLLQIIRSLDPLPDLVEYLKKSIVDEPPATLMHGGAIRPGYNEQLDELRSLARGGKEYILARQDQERKETGIASLSIGYNKIYGYYIEVSNANQDKVPAHYIRKQTLVNAERYITPDLKEWEDRILSAEEQMLELEHELFDEVRTRIISYSGTIQLNARLLAELDYYAAAAELAIQKKYTRPVLREDGRLILVKSRHPVVENLLAAGESFVANDLDIGDENRQIALVTGPNMGGKSTYLRQVGLIVLMAQAGLFIPAEKAEIPLTDRIFTRVGASDNLAAGESTFLVEMHEAANILHNATERSLILLDEIGRGTSTFDGLSLAWAIVEYLHDYPGGIHPKTLFATHYHELTDLETVLPGVFNLHVEVKEWGERVIFLRRVLPGRSGASYGIQVARLAGLPRAIIERATEVLTSLEASELNGNNVPRLAKGAKTPKIQPQQDPLQLTLFTTEERALRDALAKADIDNMTPLEALRLLADWKVKYNPPEES